MFSSGLSCTSCRARPLPGLLRAVTAVADHDADHLLAGAEGDDDGAADVADDLHPGVRVVGHDAHVGVRPGDHRQVGIALRQGRGGQDGDSEQGRGVGRMVSTRACGRDRGRCGGR